MRLVDLSPQFIRYESVVETYSVIDGDPATWDERGRPTVEKTGPREHMVFVGSLAEAQGIFFLCPKCFQENRAKLPPDVQGREAIEAAGVGVHSVQVTFANRGVPDDMGCHNAKGQPTRWEVSGSGFEDLSTTPSILIESGCGWHGFITNGEVS
jgi:hypothetical protein